MDTSQQTFPDNLDIHGHVQDKLIVNEFEKTFMIGDQPLRTFARLSNPSITRFLRFDEFKKHFDALSTKNTGVPMSFAIRSLANELDHTRRRVEESIMRACSEVLRQIVRSNVNERPVTMGDLNWFLGRLHSIVKRNQTISMAHVDKIIMNKQSSLYEFTQHYIKDKNIYGLSNYFVSIEQEKKKCNNLFCYRVIVLGKYTSEYYLYSKLLGMIGLSNEEGGEAIGDVYSLNNNGENTVLKKHIYVLISRIVQLSRILTRDEMIISTTFSEVKQSSEVVREQNMSIKDNLNSIESSQSELSVLINKEAYNKQVLARTRINMVLLIVFIVLYIAAMIALFLSTIPGVSPANKAFIIIGINAAIAILFVLSELYKLIKK
jgi:hypothetical protein